MKLSAVFNNCHFDILVMGVKLFCLFCCVWFSLVLQCNGKVASQRVVQANRRTAAVIADYEEDLRVCKRNLLIMAYCSA